MIELNLIPDVKQELLKAQRARAIVISGSIITSIVAVGIVVLLAVYIYGIQAGRDWYLSDQITKKDEELSKVSDLSEILTIQNQLTMLSELNGNKKIDSRIFDMIAAVIPPEPNSVQFSLVRIESGSGSSEDELEGNAPTIRLEGQTRAYDSMEIFKKTLDSAIVQYQEDGELKSVKLAENISTSDISFGENENGDRVVRFALTFEYPEQLFSPQYEAINFKLSVNGNVTDSYLGVPKELFTDRANDVKEGN
jgi:Tfp pilus assembly protein PilN